MNIHRLIPIMVVIVLYSSSVCAQIAINDVAASRPLTEILAEIEHQKRVSFLYEPALLNQARVAASFSVKGQVRKMLHLLLPPLNLSYEKVGRRNYIIINGKTDPLVQNQTSQGRPAREFFISGQLTDEQNQPLAGGTLFVMGTSKGTVTDELGFFQLNLPQNQATIRVSYLGYRDQYIQVQKPGRQNIQLTSTINTLTEVVVTASGIDTEQKQLAYATDVIPAAELSRNNDYNLINALAFQSPGIWTHSTSGSPGASTAIRMRGFRSINGSNQPLFILDGMPIDNTSTGNSTRGVDVSNRLIDINIQDVEKVSVLRGASAAALYGIRAANGAIVISSKKGHNGPAQFSFQSSIGINRVNQLPARQLAYSQGAYIDGQAVYRGPETNVNTSYGPLISNLEFDGSSDYPYDQNGQLVPAGTGNGQSANIYDPYNTFFVNGWINQQHLSVKGGNPLFKYYLSLGHLLESGVVPQATYERLSAKGFFSFQASKRLSISLLPTVSRSSSVRMKKGSLFSGIPLGLFRSPNTFDIGNGWQGRQASRQANAYLLDNGQQRSYRANGSYDNPFWAINHNPYQDEVVRNIQQLQATYELSPSISLIARLGADHYTDHRKNAFDIHSGSHPKGYLRWTDINYLQLNSDLLLQASRQWGDNWHFSATVGHNYNQSRLSVVETKGDELQQAGLFLLSNAVGLSVEEAIFQKKIAGTYADIHWSFRNCLYLNLSGRKDWSSTLPRNNNSFFYPGAHLGVDISRWLKWRSTPRLTYGKLRFSYSLTGNDAATYLTDTYYNTAVAGGDDLLPSLSFPAFGITALERSATLGNSQLKPETAHNFEIGAVLKWWENRLKLDVTWYKAIVQDQIINAQLSAASGFLNSPVNAGTIENQGWELQVSSSWLNEKDWNWNTKLNFSRFRSLVTTLAPGVPNIVLGSYTNLSSMIIEGQPYGVLVGTSIKRTESGERIIDNNGFPLLNEHQTIIGDPNPDWLLGISNELTYRRFSFSFQWDIRKGGDIWNGTKGVLSYLGLSEESGRLRNNQGVVFEGVNMTGEPNTIAVDLANPNNGMGGIYWRRYGFLGLAEEHIEDASWIRLREISCVYRFPLSWKRSSDSQARISLHGHNLLLFTPYSGIDPETNLRGDSNIIGWDYFNMPGVKGMSLKVGVDF